LAHLGIGLVQNAAALRTIAAERAAINPRIPRRKRSLRCWPDRRATVCRIVERNCRTCPWTAGGWADATLDPGGMARPGIASQGGSDKDANYQRYYGSWSNRSDCATDCARGTAAAEVTAVRPASGMGRRVYSACIRAPSSLWAPACITPRAWKNCCN